MATNRDDVSTMAGAGAGFLMLEKVDWTKVVGGETSLAAVALLIILMGYLAYRRRGDPPTSPPPPAVAA